jgi:hypothetical protein
MNIIDFIRDRARFYNCPVCGRSLKGCDIQVLSHEDERFHLQVTCAQCQVTFIVVLAVAGSGVEEIETMGTPVTSITISSSTSPSMESHPDPEPITIDEILDVHLYLKNFQGTLKDLLQQPDHSRG